MPVVSLRVMRFVWRPIVVSMIALTTVTGEAPGQTETPDPASDQRSAFDKSARQGKVFTHVNDWKFITQAREPLDVDHLLSDSRDSVKQDLAYTAHLLERYGLAGIYLQNNHQHAPLAAALDAFAKAGNDRTVAWFVTRAPGREAARSAHSTSAKAEAIARGWIEALAPRRELMFEHPNYDRVDGHPVIVCYGSAPAADPEVWAEAVRIIEAEVGRFIWLRSSHHWNGRNLQQWIPHLDGVTQYSTHGLAFERFHELAEPMHGKWSHKIFEANAGPVHQSVLQGEVGADWGYRTAFMRFTLDYALDLKPDSLHITNWNDVEENSHIAPSYLRRDSLLRIIRDRTRALRGAGPNERTEPELIVTNKIDLMLGQMLNIEVLGLPMASATDSNKAEVTLDLRLADPRGLEIHRFEPRNVRFDQMHAELFRVQSADLGDGEPPAAVYPVLSYQHDGQRHGPYRLRPTRLRIGQTPTDLTWMTPLEAWRPEFAVSWAAGLPGTYVDWSSLSNGGLAGEAATHGQTLIAPPGGPRPVYVYRTIAPGTRGEITRTRLLHNGRLNADFKPRQRRERGTTTWFKRAHDAPFSWLEIETTGFTHRSYRYGDQTLDVREPTSLWLSLPVYLATEPNDLNTVQVPVAIAPADERFAHLTDNVRQRWRTLAYAFTDIRTVRVPIHRVPFFHYDFDRPTGGMVLDVSGHDHHGWMSNRRTRVGHLGDGPFGFNFAHHFAKFDQPIRAAEQLGDTAPKRRASATGDGYLRFDGRDDYVFFHARTDFPFVSTIELTIRPADPQREMIVLSTLPLSGAREQRMNIGLDANGRLIVESPFRTNEYDGSAQVLRSERVIPPDQWTHVAVVNDGRHIRAYLNGEQVDQRIDSPLWGAWNLKNFLFLGGRKVDDNPFRKGTKRQFKWEARYEGDLAELRITGRPLEVDEFLDRLPKNQSRSDR